MRAARLVLILFIILSAALTWPLIRHAGGGVEDLHDALLNTWILAWDARQLLTDPVHLFDANIFYPYRNTLAFSEIILPQALLALPFTMATGNPVLGYNVAVLLSFALSGFATYLLVARLTGDRWAGVAAGVVFAFNSYKMSNIAQAQLLALQWLPLALLYLDRTLRARGANRWRDALLLTIFTVLQALCSFYYAILSALTLLLYAAAVLALRATTRRGALRASAALAVAALAVLPFAIPYVQVEGSLGFSRTLAESVPFSASLAQYAQSLPGNLLYGSLAATSPVVIGGYPLDSLFPGFVTLLLSVLGVIACWKRPRLWLFPLLLAVGAFLLSLGPTLTLAPGQALDVPAPMPYRLLYLVPGMDALRAPVRFAALVFLGLAMLAGVAVAAMRRAGAGRILPRLVGAVAVCLVVAEVATSRPVAVTPVPTGADVPSVYRWLAQQPPGVVLELPMAAETPGRGLLTQYFSTYHWQRTPDGYSGFVPPKHGEIAYELQYFPSERSLSLLQGLDVRYVLVHSDLMAEWDGRSRRLSAFAGDIVETKRFGATIVYAIATPQVASIVQASLYLPPAGATAKPYTASLVLFNQGERSAVTKPTQALHYNARWATADGRVVRTEEDDVYAPIVVSEAGIVPITLLPPADGTYALNITMSLPRGQTASASATVQVSASAALPAQVAPIRLVNARTDSTSYQPGGSMRIALRWRALGKINAYYSVFVRLLDKNGVAIAQADGQPGGGARPTLLWAPGEEIEDAWTLRIPSTAPAGRYTVEAGVYWSEDLSPRLTLDAAGLPAARLLFAAVRVAPPLAIAATPSFAMGAVVGDRVTLIGFDLGGCTWEGKQCQVQRASTLDVTVYWRVEQDVVADYAVLVHLADSAGNPLSQHDGQPRQGSYPTSVWQAGDIVSDRHTLSLPNAIPTGSYRLLAGLYDPLTGSRLPTAGHGDVVELVTVIVR